MSNLKRTYAEIISQAQVMATGLKANQAEVARRGIDTGFVTELEKDTPRGNRSQRRAGKAQICPQNQNRRTQRQDGYYLCQAERGKESGEVVYSQSSVVGVRYRRQTLTVDRLCKKTG